VHDDAHRETSGDEGREDGPDGEKGTAARLAGELADEAAVVAEDVAGHVVEPVAEWRWTRGDSSRIGVAALTVVIGGLAASRGVPSWERAAFLKLNQLPDWLYPLLWLPMQIGNVWVGTVVAVVAAGILVRSRRSALVLVLVPVVAWIAAKGVKSLVGRGRPADMGLAVQQRGAAETGLGYLSGHATVAFALAGAVAAHLRRPWPAIVLGVAGAVGVARVYVGVHLPLDVIGGAALGLLIGEGARVIELRARRRRPRTDHPVSAAVPAPD
jgi:membrane-associated phospholipid phosphatase